jgi:hypothetical protein
MRSREEHVAWCKERALEYAYNNELGNAIASMISDMKKHPECEVNSGLSMVGMLYAHQFSQHDVIEWIKGFR